MEDITDADEMHAKRVCKDFEIKNLGEYHDLYLKSDTLLLADVFKNFRKMYLNIYHLDPVKFLSAPGLPWQAALKRTEVKLKLLTDTDTSQFNEDFIKNYNEESDEGYFLEIGVEYPEKLNDLHNDLPFLPERMKIEKVEKLVTNLHDKTEYVIHIRNLKQGLNHALILKKVYREIKFNQKVWLKPYIDMNTKLRQKARNNFEEYFFKLMNNAVFGKTMENVIKHRNIKLVK